jgi:methionyl aminopeptidase
MSIESAEDLEGIRLAGAVVALALRAMRTAVRAGITTRELDHAGEACLRREGARSAPQMVYGFPGFNLISVNDEIVYGIPGDRRLRPGDVVKLDVTAELDGYIAEAFHRGLEVTRVGAPVRAIGAAVERHVRGCGFSVVRELSGHGVGRTIHEEPNVPNYDEPRASARLTHGMVLTIEPLIAARSSRALTGRDGWTLRTNNGSLAAHYEHTVIVWHQGPEVVTAAL